MSEPIYASDLMTEARKNPEKYEGKRYKVVQDYAITLNKTGFFTEVTFKHGWLESDGGYNCAVFMDTQLEEIKPEPKPVPFMEAVKAFAAVKTILCKYDGRCNIYKNGGRFKQLKDQNDWGPSAHEILHGTWYIIDEEDTP